ncbi:MAG: carboxypeptidase-like regulatory domain-containing protein [Thermodesulfovibrionales bacterium]|nr:carboxypeptidase-like regulatory domain-containing protein [Thermodesulfovibrionales bacterium]
MKKKSFFVIFLSAFLLMLTTSSLLHAVCPDNGVTPLTVGSINPNNGFPLWFQDTNGRGVELCLDQNFCFFDPVDPNNPFSVQIGFGPEAFWWSADATITNGTVDAILILAVEAAFLNEEPVDGDQFPFTRLRIRADVPAAGTYTVVHPYGREVFVVTTVGPGNEINMTRDIPVVGFNTTHNGAVGPLLVAVNPPPPTGFLGDFNIEQTVTGSPCNTNFFSIQAPGVDLGSGSGVAVSTNQFAVQGKIFTGVLPVPLQVQRATYSRTTTGGQIDVFATSAPDATLTLSGTGFANKTMTGDGAGNFYTNVSFTSGFTLPNFVTVTATRTGNSSTTINKVLTDVVTITLANYTITGTGGSLTGSLEIRATSSDLVGPVTLTAQGLGNLSSGQLIVPGLTIPPPIVTVSSSRGGIDTEPVTISTGAPPPPTTFSLSGTITFGGIGLQGVTVALSGSASATTTTGPGGTYTFSNLSPGTYTITPSLQSYAFTPANATRTITNANITGVDFTATGIYSISGTIRNDLGIGVANRTINLTGTTAVGSIPVSRSVVTAANGTYSFTALPNGTYTITPAPIAGTVYEPASRNVTINNANVINQDFRARRAR